MEKEEIDELKKKKEKIQKEIDDKQWQGFKRRFGESSLLEKIIFIIGVIGLFFLLIEIGSVIRGWIG